MTKRERPEAKIQKALIRFLEDRGWLVEPTHGSAYQKGFPDLWCYHPQYGYRWIDCKVEGRYSFTKAQKIKWSEWATHGVGIWILTEATEVAYDKLFREPNWSDYWKESWGVLPNVQELLRDLWENDE